MKILAAGDLHGDSLLSENLAKRSENENVDLVILCGDISGNNEDTTNMIGPFVKKGKKVLLVSGNHETFATADFLSEVYNITNLHGYSVKYKDIGLFGCGGANIGLEALKEEEIFDVLKTGFGKVKNLGKKIMVTHVHPSGSKMERFSSFVPGSSGLKKAIDEFQPDFLLCSHVHEAEGIEEKIGKTTVLNVGRKGKIINL
ncbi:MAG: metallophosphoesterase [Candidatus Woesearchaeota archaeon]